MPKINLSGMTVQALMDPSCRASTAVGEDGRGLAVQGLCEAVEAH